MAFTYLQALYPTACLMEHSCLPNVKLNYSKDLAVSPCLLHFVIILHRHEIVNRVVPNTVYLL
jgi:hypothetical protein